MHTQKHLKLKKQQNKQLFNTWLMVIRFRINVYYQDKILSFIKALPLLVLYEKSAEKEGCSGKCTFQMVPHLANLLWFPSLDEGYWSHLEFANWWWPMKPGIPESFADWWWPMKPGIPESFADWWWPMKPGMILLWWRIPGSYKVCHLMVTI